MLQAVPGAPPHALVFTLERGRLVLDWKPDWLKSNNREPSANKPKDVLAIHRTGADNIGSTINEFTNPAVKKGIHISWMSTGTCSSSRTRATAATTVASRFGLGRGTSTSARSASRS